MLFRSGRQMAGVLSVSWSAEPVEGLFRATAPWGPGYVTLLSDERGRVARVVLSDQPSGCTNEPEGSAAWAMEQVRDYLAGGRMGFDLICRMQEKGSFHRAVVERLLHVGYGQVVTYGELARLAGRPGAARAVGRIMAVNPCPLLVPCHRVVAARGLGGYGPGLPWKRALLRLEGWDLQDGEGRIRLCRILEEQGG